MTGSATVSPPWEYALSRVPPKGASTNALTLAAILARAGYIAVPLQQRGSDRLVDAKIGATAVSLRLDSGAPFDLLLDTALVSAESANMHITNVLSGYWSFTPSRGHWAMVSQLHVPPLPLPVDGLEAKIEPLTDADRGPSLGATVLADRGAIVDYATDTLYLLSSSPPVVARTQQVSYPTLRAALDQAGQYRTFIALLQRAGLASLLDNARQSAPMAPTDSVRWLGLRVAAEQLAGVGAMQPNEMHLGVIHGALNERFEGSNWYTIFVPTDAAFARLPPATRRALQADPARLARLLTAHVFSGAAIDTAAMRTLVRGVASSNAYRAFGFHTVGARLDVDQLSQWDDGRVMARATIVHPDFRIAHGTIIAHGVDRVLGGIIPPLISPDIATTLARQGYVGIPLRRREDGNGYFVRATVHGVPISLDLDTGVPVEVALDGTAATRLRLTPGGGYPVTFGAVPLGSMMVDTVNRGDVIQAAGRQGYRASVGVIGARLFARYGARLDWGAGMLYLRLLTH